MDSKFNINSRRYIGCKTKLLKEIDKIVSNYNYQPNVVFGDLFAGTGVVASYFANKGYKVIVNDTLYSNYIAYQAFLGEGDIDEGKIDKIIKEFNNISAKKLHDNYFSSIYGGKYFSIDDSKIIGYIRNKIEKNKKQLSNREYFYLITSLMYAADRIANTVGHFESYLNKIPCNHGIVLRKLNINKNIFPAEIFMEDANFLVKKIKCDVAYVDPPYNARQYINFYHVLENLARWNKPKELEGKTMKFKRNELKSDYCRKKAPFLFEDLINNIDAKLIIVSYNNTYNAKSDSSINTISESQIEAVLSKKGKIYKKEINYNAFNAGKTNLKNHKEFLYVCEVYSNG